MSDSPRSSPGPGGATPSPERRHAVRSFHSPSPSPERKSRGENNDEKSSLEPSLSASNAPMSIDEEKKSVEPVNTRSIFIGNIDGRSSLEDIRKLFIDQGKNVVKIDLKAGFAFVFIEDEGDIRDLLRVLDGTVLGGRRIRAELARGDGHIKRREDERRRMANTPSKSLFVVNFNPIDTRERDIRREFEVYGNIVKIDMRRNFAFVEYEKLEEAVKAMSELNGSRILGREITVEFSSGRSTRDESRKRSRSRSRSRSPVRRRPPPPQGYVSRHSPIRHPHTYVPLPLHYPPPIPHPHYYDHRYLDSDPGRYPPLPPIPPFSSRFGTTPSVRDFPRSSRDHETYRVESRINDPSRYYDDRDRVKDRDREREKEREREREKEREREREREKQREREEKMIKEKEEREKEKERERERERERRIREKERERSSRGGGGGGGYSVSSSDGRNGGGFNRRYEEERRMRR